MLKKIDFFIFFIILLLLKYISSEERLIFAFEINRHGARAPAYGVKDGIDLFQEEWTSNGELSDVGKRQLYLLGSGVRKRYIKEYKLLSENYNPQEIYIKSTDYNRTIDSVYSFIQGLYPNGFGKNISEKVINNTNITYPPNINENYKKEFDNILNKSFLNGTNYALPYNMEILPVHISNPLDDKFLLFDSNYCPALREQLDNVHNNKTIKNYSKKLKEKTKDLFIESEKKFTNKNIKNNNFLDDFWTLYRYEDNLVCNKQDERDFSFFNEKYKDYNISLEDLIEDAKNFLVDNYYISNNYTKNAVIDSSTTLKNIVKWMEKAIDIFNNTDSTDINATYIKYVIYSAHDLSIGALERFLSLYLNESTMEYADFGESRYFELYYDKNKTWDRQFQVKYFKGIGKNKKSWQFSSFKYYIDKKAYSKKSINDFCLKKPKYDINITGATIMVILSVLDGVLIVLLILFCAKKR